MNVFGFKAKGIARSQIDDSTCSKNIDGALCIPYQKKALSAAASDHVILSIFSSLAEQNYRFRATFHSHLEEEFRVVGPGDKTVGRINKLYFIA